MGITLYYNADCSDCARQAGLALYVPPIRNYFGRKKPGCNGDACEI